MASGVDWALEAVLKYCQLDPEIVKKQIAGTAQIIVDTKAQLDRIEANQKTIIALLGKDFEYVGPDTDADADAPTCTNGNTEGNGSDTGG